MTGINNQPPQNMAEEIPTENSHSKALSGRLHPAGSPLRSIHLTVGDLRRAIEGLPDDLEIYCQAGNNDLGNIWGPHALDRATYSFFGSRIPCLIINHSRRESEMGILWRVGLPEDDDDDEEEENDERSNRQG